MKQNNELCIWNRKDLLSFLFNSIESIVQENVFWGFVQKCYFPELLHLGILVQGLF